MTLTLLPCETYTSRHCSMLRQRATTSTSHHHSHFVLTQFKTCRSEMVKHRLQMIETVDICCKRHNCHNDAVCIMYDVHVMFRQ